MLDLSYKGAEGGVEGEVEDCSVSYIFNHILQAHDISVLAWLLPDIWVPAPPS